MWQVIIMGSPKEVALLKHSYHRHRQGLQPAEISQGALINNKVAMDHTILEIIVTEEETEMAAMEKRV